MQRQTTWMIIYALAITTISFGFLTISSQAQVPSIDRNTSQVPLNDGARYLRNLENPSASQWSFATENQQKVRDYELAVSEPEIKITEQKPPEWSNTGDDPNYSILVDVYDFTEPTENLEEKSR